MNILITGAGRGIGFALAKAYLAQGHQVIATYRNEAALSALKALPEQNQLRLIPLEVTDSAAINALAEQLVGQTIDILINNAGIYGGSEQSLNNLNTSDWLQTLAVNTIAPIEVSLALLEQLKTAEQAKIITISSAMGSLTRNQPDYYAYRSSKAALNKAMQCLAHDLKADGIIVCPFHPGWVRTDMGGQEADISVDECVEKLIPTIASLTQSNSGQFFGYNGEIVPW